MDLNEKYQKPTTSITKKNLRRKYQNKIYTVNNTIIL